MSATSFRSVFMVASCAGAALGCYLVSLRVASERAALEDIQSQIVLAERDIRVLQTEIGTRGRLAQLERWNVKVLALSAPSADQFLGGSFELARMVAPERKVDLEAPVVLASAPADAPKPQVPGVAREETDDSEASVAGKKLLHSASLKSDPESKSKPAAPKPIASTAPASKAPPASDKATSNAPKPDTRKVAASSAKPGSKKVVDKPAAAPNKPVTKAAKLAKRDPLAPIPARASSNKAKDAGSKQ